VANESWLPLGEMLKDYYAGNPLAAMMVKSSIESDRPMEAATFFRLYKDFSRLERSALKRCYGKVLDIGAGAGAHSLYLQEKGFDVTAIDICDGAVEIMKDRGLKKVFCTDIYSFPEQKFDTIILLMNGIGVTGDLEGLAYFLQQVKKYIANGGQLLFDTADISYVSISSINRSSLREFPSPYYGIVWYQLGYKDTLGKPYPWLYIDKKTLKRIADENGYKMKVLKRNGSQYLVKMALI